MSETRPSLVYGMGLTLLIASAAYAAQLIPFPPFTLEGDRHPVDAILLAILIGIALRNSVRLPPRFAAGIRYAVHQLLPIAIVLMGARLDFSAVLRVSSEALLISGVCVVLAIASCVWLCKKTDIGLKLGLLIGVGTAICGGTAIAVCSPVIEADDNDTGLAVTAITIFGLVLIPILPLLGAATGLSQDEFGMWAGTSIHAVPQVMAAGFAYGERAGDTAVVVKLVRVLLLAPVVLVLGAWYRREKLRRQQAHVGAPTPWTTLFPPFILGFLALALLNSLSLLPDFTLNLKDSPLWRAQDVGLSMAQLSTTLSAFLVTMSMAGVGLGVNLKGLAQVGPKALYVGLIASVILCSASLGLILVMRG